MASARSDEDAVNAAILELTACLELVQHADLAYASCVMNAGLFELWPAPLPATEEEREALANRTADFERLLPPATALGSCRLLCSAPTTVASRSCCAATAGLRACQPTPALASERLAECKRVFDRGFQFSHECRGVSAGDVGLVIATAAVLAAVVAVATSARRQLHRQHRQLQQAAHAAAESALELRLARSRRGLALLGAWRQVSNLVWKNLVIKQRRPVALALEQSLPALLSSSLVLLANLDALFASAGAPGAAPARTYEASARETALFCLRFTVSELADLGGPSTTMGALYASGQAVLGMFFLVAYMKFVSSTAAAMVRDKETRVREFMKIMGQSDAALLASWCLTSAVLSTPLAFVLAAQLKYGGVLPATDLGVLVLLFWSLSLAIVAFCHALAPFFHKSRAAAVMSVLLWLVLFFPFYAVQAKASHALKFAAALAPPTAFGLALDAVLRAAQLGSGFAYSLGVQESPVDVPSAVAMSAMLLLDALLLLAAGWYLEQVLPQKFGVRKPWNFFFARAYWASAYPLADESLGRGQGACESTAGAQTPPALDARALDPDLALSRPSVTPCSPACSALEPVSAALALQEQRGECLEIRGLRKVFPSPHGAHDGKVAVAGLDLTLYSGQITALLGHNGAGKTTVISMLTGLLPPTAGDATMFGRSLRRDMDQLRRVIGVCPQHDVLFDDMTVEEHLQFFGTMKHVPPRELDRSVAQLLDDVGLAGARASLAHTLSGGQKRKLSVAIALIGDSKLVFLDEPTSGMDPFSRRFTWNLLQKHRAGRVIVLTTHFMDEADILGDRIAIVADGRLRCAGSSLFLKARFGAGYNLTAIRARACDASAIVAFLRRFVPGACCVSDHGSELVFQLPTAAASSTTSALPNMLEALEENMRALGVERYGISVTTLEQVFLRIARDRDDAAAACSKLGASSPAAKGPEKAPKTSLASLEAERSTAPPSFRQQLVALVIKRVQIARRDRKTLLHSVGIPLFFLAILVALPTIQVADFRQEYASVLPTAEQQEACPVETIHASLFTPKALSRCLGARNFEYCELGVVPCSAAQCCDAAYAASPWFPCNNCDFWPPVLPARASARAKYRCYNRECLKKADAKLQVTLNAFLVAFIAMLAFAFVPAAIVAFVVREKSPEQNAKALQLISGTSVAAYWVSNWLHDATVTSASVVLAAFTIPLSYAPLRGHEEALGVALLVVSHALASISLAHLLSRRFTRHAVAQTTLLVLGVGVGGLLSILSFLCRVIDFSFSPTFSLAVLDRNYLRWLFLLVPGYAFNTGIYEIATRKLSRASIFDGASAVNATAMAIANPPSVFGLFKGLGSSSYSTTSGGLCVECWESNSDGCCTRQVFDVDVAAASIGYGFAEAVVFTALLLLLEHRETTWGSRVKTLGDQASRLQRGSSKTASEPQDSKASSSTAPDEDADVAAERQRVATADPREALVTIRSLHHRYPRPHLHGQPKVAVQDLSLALSPGECFGYLGVNGAGKSTTMKVLTAQLAPTSGFVTLGGFDLATDARLARGVLGYCPQFDALHDLLTVQEQLALYARLKGVPERAVAAAVHEMTARVDLAHSRRKLTCTLSGGNKRKVSTAIALLGSPRVVLLDEPSTGVDAGARRKLWDVISAVVAKREACVLLTTHSMEECEALSTRVGVLVGGALQCLGSAAHLKHKFGRGYTVEVKLGAPPHAVVERAVVRVSALLRTLRREDAAGAGVGALQLTLEDVAELEARAVGRTVDSLAASYTFTTSTSASEVVSDASALGSGDADVAGARAGKIASATGSGRYVASLLRSSGAVSADAFARWWAAEDQSDALREFFRAEFPGSELVEQQDELFRFQVPTHVADAAQGAATALEAAAAAAGGRRRRPHEVFRALERATQRLNVSEYGVSDTSLEHIFNNFAAATAGR